MRNIIIDQERCILCGSCVDNCVRGIYELTDERIEVGDPSLCIFCGHCVALCSEDAIQLPVVNMQEFKPAPGQNQWPEPELLLELFRSRRSTRRYKDHPVEKEKIDKIIEVGRFAPTGGNLQPFRFSVVQTPKVLQSIKDMMADMVIKHAQELETVLKEKVKKGESLSVQDRIQRNYIDSMRRMAKANKEGVDKMLWGAPVLISLHAPPEFETAEVNAGLAGMQMALMAEALGLGTCYIGLVDRAANTVPEIKTAMKIQEDRPVCLAFVTGYPDVDFHKLVSRKSARVTWA
jgi:nitroreductase/NAD-dependent dihydropyrimidine dehydrogenase PreA subunit